MGGAFSHDHERKQQLEERLHQGPGEEARQQAAATSRGPPPGRWTLDTIRASFDWLTDCTRRGVWRLLDRLGDVTSRCHKPEAPAREVPRWRFGLVTCARRGDRREVSDFPPI
jgi:hypothetical protein